MNPAAVEARQLTLALSTLIADMKLPGGLVAGVGIMPCVSVHWLVCIDADQVPVQVHDWTVP